MNPTTDNFQIPIPWGTAFKSAIFGLHPFLFFKLCYRWMIKRPIMMEAEIEYEPFRDNNLLAQKDTSRYHEGDEKKEDKNWIS